MFTIHEVKGSAELSCLLRPLSLAGAPRGIILAFDLSAKVLGELHMKESQPASKY